MKKDLLTVKKGPRRAVRAASCTGPNSLSSVPMPAHLIGDRQGGEHQAQFVDVEETIFGFHYSPEA